MQYRHLSILVFVVWSSAEGVPWGSIFFIDSDQGVDVSMVHAVYLLDKSRPAWCHEEYDVLLTTYEMVRNDRAKFADAHTICFSGASGNDGSWFCPLATADLQNLMKTAVNPSIPKV